MLSSLRAAAPLVALAALLTVSTESAAERFYQIGNSFTYDSLPYRVQQMSQSTTRPMTADFHVRCNASLKQIVNNPGTCVDPIADGPWYEALPNGEWDHVVVQPYAANNSTMQDDINSIETIVAAAEQFPANSDTKWYLYQSWGTLTSPQLWSAWLRPAGSFTTHKQDYYYDLQDQLAARGLTTEIVPTGDVLYHFWNNADQYDFYDDQTDLYRDLVHLSPIGRFIAGTTVLTTLTRQNATGAPDPGYSSGLSAAQRATIQQTVWRIVNAVQNPGDLNADGAINSADYADWSAAYGGRDAGLDANLDGVVNAADYTVWRDRSASSAVATPEPGSAALVFAVVLAAANRCRRRG